MRYANISVTNICKDTGLGKIVFIPDTVRFDIC